MTQDMPEVTQQLRDRAGVQIHVPFCSGSDALQFSSVQSLSRVQLFATPWIAAHQASLSITNSRSSLRLASIESVMPSNHLVLGRPLLLLPLIPPSIKVFSNESTLTIILLRWMVHMNGGVCQNLGGEKEQSHFACPQHNFFFWLHTWHVGS